MDKVIWQGTCYEAETTEQDRIDFAGACQSHGTRRCAITEPHSSYVHLVMALAELNGTTYQVIETI